MALKELELIKLAEEEALNISQDAEKFLVNLEADKKEKISLSKKLSDEKIDFETKKIDEDNYQKIIQEEKKMNILTNEQIKELDERWEESKQKAISFILKEAKQRYVNS